jgi:hypothetical protein
MTIVPFAPKPCKMYADPCPCPKHMYKYTERWGEVHCPEWICVEEEESQVTTSVLSLVHPVQDDRQVIICNF